MKKFIFTFLFSAAFIFSYAQLVTISETHQIPQIGDTIHYQDANTFGFDEEGVGAVTDKLWDFGALMDAATTVDYIFLDPTTTAQSSMFPNANLAREISNEAGYFYYETTSTEINRWGFYGGATLWSTYNSSATEFRFPITAGDNYNSTYYGEFPLQSIEDSTTLDQGQIIAQADMQGTLILPTGTFIDVLRIHIIESFHIKTWFMGSVLDDTVIEDDYYYWFHDTILKPVLIYGTTDQNSSQIGEVLRYQLIDIATSVNEVDLSNMIIVYPNPTKDVVNVRGSEIERIDVYDVVGKMISSYEVNSFNTEIDLSDNPEGILILKIYSKNNIVVKRVVLEK